VDRQHNLTGSRLLEADPDREGAERRLMHQPPYSMGGPRREVVLAALQERCAQRQWTLLAAHVRSTHVHLIVEADLRPERIMNELKAYASRCLNRQRLDETKRKRWARHGSTRWLWNRENESAAIHYVVDEQGEPMAVFVAAPI